MITVLSDTGCEISADKYVLARICGVDNILYRITVLDRMTKKVSGSEHFRLIVVLN
jgi:hypothetical protein